MKEIIYAIGEYILENSDIPAPADLHKILCPPAKPLDRAVYTRICKKIEQGGTFIMPQEHAYVREYERQQLERFK
jgi:hypothetical protein